MSQDIPVPFSSLDEASSLTNKQILIGEGDNLERITVENFAVFFQILNKIAKPISPSETGPFVANQWYNPKVSSNDPGTSYPNLTPAFDENGNSITSLKAKNGYDTLFWYSGTFWTKKEVKMPDSNYLFIAGNNKLNIAAYALYDKAIASNGNVAPLIGAISIVMLPLKRNTTYTISGYLASSNKYMALKNAAGVTQGSVTTLTGSAKTFTTPADIDTFLNFYGKLVAEGDNWDDALMLNEGSTALPYEPYTEIITGINDKSLIALGLSVNNSVPSPVNDLNAVNKKYFDTLALRTNDLSVSTSLNLAHPDYIVTDEYVNSSGGITTGGTGWKYIKIPVDSLPDGQKITFGRFTINGGGYAAFRNFTNNTLIQSIGAITGATKTVTKPTGATHLCVDIKRPADDGTNYTQLTVNLGDSLIAYQSPLGAIQKIKGFDIAGTGGGGGTAYDQSLNKADSVQFAKLTAGTIETSVIVANLPTSPTGLPTGRAWIDTTIGNTVKIV